MHNSLQGNELELLRRVREGDRAAVDALLAQHRSRLTEMVRLRLDRRVARRVDQSDIVQEALTAAAGKIEQFAATPQVPFYLWLRQFVQLKLAEAHRKHLAVQQRDAGREVSLVNEPLNDASSVWIVDELVAQLSTPSQAAVKAESIARIRDLLAEMDAVDREILALLHFEQLSFSQCAQVLGLSKSGAHQRYLRAIERLQVAMQQPRV